MPLICFGYISTHHTLQHTPIYFNSTNCDSTTSFFSFIIYLLAFICIFSLEWFLWKGLGKVCEMDCWLRRGKEWSFRFTSRFPNLTFSRELWVVSKRMRSRTHEAQMSFRWRVAGLSLGPSGRTAQGRLRTSWRLYTSERGMSGIPCWASCHHSLTPDQRLRDDSTFLGLQN